MKNLARTAATALIAGLVLLISAGTASAGYGTPGPEADPWGNISVVCQDGYADIVYDFGNTGDAATTTLFVIEKPRPCSAFATSARTGTTTIAASPARMDRCKRTAVP